MHVPPRLAKLQANAKFNKPKPKPKPTAKPVPKRKQKQKQRQKAESQDEPQQDPKKEAKRCEALRKLCKGGSPLPGEAACDVLDKARDAGVQRPKPGPTNPWSNVSYVNVGGRRYAAIPLPARRRAGNRLAKDGRKFPNKQFAPAPKGVRKASGREKLIRGILAQASPVEQMSEVNGYYKDGIEGGSGGPALVRHIVPGLAPDLTSPPDISKEQRAAVAKELETDGKKMEVVFAPELPPFAGSKDGYWAFLTPSLYNGESAFEIFGDCGNGKRELVAKVMHRPKHLTLFVKEHLGGDWKRFAALQRGLQDPKTSNSQSIPRKTVEWAYQRGRTILIGASANPGKRKNGKPAGIINWNELEEERVRLICLAAKAIAKDFAEQFPEAYAKHVEAVKGLRVGLQFVCEAFPTVELAENVVTRMHADFGNLPGSWSVVVIGGVVMEEKDGGRLVGGCQVLPEVGVIIRTSPGTVIFCQCDRWLHGNVPLATQGGNAFREAMILFLSENVVKYGKK